MKHVLVGVAVCLLVSEPIPLKSQGQESPKVAELMRKKLGHAQKVLEGIALNKFDEIGRSAEELILISKAAEWSVVKTPQYEIHSNSFRRAAESLVEKAKDKNVDGVALAYVDLTLSCVKCHKHVRDTRMTGFSKPKNVARK
jgi:hypothetical protein